MTALEAMRLSAQPTEPMGTGGVTTAYDAQGNPVCPDCGSGAFTFAALANSGRTQPCLCRPPDGRMQEVPAFLAEAMLLMVSVLDLLEGDQHPWDCHCGGCRAQLIIRKGMP